MSSPDSTAILRNIQDRGWLKAINNRGSMRDDAVIMGGGKRGLEDYKNLPDLYKPIRIACNHHIYNQKIATHYLCFVDQPDQHPDLKAAISSTSSIKVSTRHIDSANIVIEDHKKYCIYGAGQLAVWVALKETPGNVYLCGFDLYENDPEKHEEHIMRWTRFLYRHKESVHRIIPMSGPLVDMVGWFNGHSK